VHIQELDDSVSTWDRVPERVELDEVLTAVAHELGAPVRSVLAHTGHLLDGPSTLSTEDTQGRLEWLRRAGKDLDALMRGIAELAMIGQHGVQRREVDVTQVVENIADRRLGAGDRHRVVVQPGLQTWADADLLRRLFEEVIDNAIKFSAPKPEPRIDVGARGDVFTVQDNGVGFEPRHTLSLGAPFRRLHGREFAGYGMGLCMVRRVLAHHGGALSVRSRPDAGCVVAFTFTLGEA
jgi:signal transduction histidine kinase